MIELRHLRYFLAAADTSHFGRAAKRLGISQPTISQQIRELETEMGSELFERRGRGVQLTASGEMFRTYASRALEDVSAGQRALFALSNKEAGELRVAYLPSMTAALVVPAIANVLRKNPRVRVVAYEGRSRRVERLVLEGKADVGLGMLPVRAQGLHTEPLFEGRLVLVVSRSHRLAKTGVTSARLSDVENEPFALLSRSLRARSLADAAFARARVAPRIALEADTVATALAVVREGLAVAVLPEPPIAASDRLAIIPLEPRPEAHVTAFFYRKDAPRSALAEAFAKEARTLTRTS